jgi:quercetin dioxygenase-like cupin family protein
VLVEYGPGGYSLGHTHDKSAFIYATVLEGATRSQANDGPVTTYKARQSFSELPGDRHGVSANASKTKPAKLRDVSDEKTNAHGPLAKAGLQSMRPGPPEMGVGDEHGPIALRDNR